MKIVQAVGWYFPEALGGTEVYVRALCRHFREAGHTVLVAAPDPSHDRERTYEHDGVPVYRYPIPRQPTRDEAQGSAVVRGAERFHEWLGLEAPDVVHLHTFVTGLGLAELRAAAAAGACTIVTTHSSSLGFLCARGTLMQWGDRPCDGLVDPAKCAACLLEHRGMPRVAARAVAAMPAGVARLAAHVPGRAGTALGMSDLIRCNLERENALLAAADRFVVLTDGARAILHANGLGNGHVVVNRLGAEMPVEAPAVFRPSHRPVSIGYVGRYESIKGVEVLAHAVSRIDRSVPMTVEFRGPVSTESERAVRRRVEEIAAGDPRVRFADAVPHDRIADALREYDALCCPAICFEGGPTVALEAHAVGTPVVGSRIGGLAEIVRDDVDGMLVPPNDAAALARLLRDIARDPEHTVDRWRRQVAPPRTMRQVAADYLELYQLC